MPQFALICLPDFLKSSSKKNVLHARHFNETRNKLKHPKNIATTMTRLSQKASSRSLRFYKRSLLFFSVLCTQICGTILSNYLDAIGLRFVRHHSTHSIRRHICLHTWPFYGFLVVRQSLALSKKDNKTICTSILYAGRSLYWCIQSAKCVLFEIKS